MSDEKLNPEPKLPKGNPEDYWPRPTQSQLDQATRHFGRLPTQDEMNGYAEGATLEEQGGYGNR